MLRAVTSLSPSSPPRVYAAASFSSSSSSAASSSWGKTIRQSLHRTTLRVVGLTSLALAVAVAIEYKSCQDVDINSPKQKKKRVLVLPFHRMKLVEQSKFSLAQRLSDDTEDGGGDDEKILEVEVKDLVDTILAAANDPNIVALYGKFGHGHRFSSGGWSHVEEVRDALKVFKQSHRVHRNPNRQHQSLNVQPKNRKLMYAYADSFANPADSGNKEYYLASVFTHLHLQENGELNLFGLSTYNSFWKDFLDKNGIKVHVFKHGIYKNSPNAFSENTYTKAHKENASKIMKSINTMICEKIVLSRSKRGLNTFDANVWNMINEYGTMPSINAKILGLVDYLPKLDPLDALLESNSFKPASKENKDKKLFKEKWKNESDLDNFDAVESISYKKYSSVVKKRKQIEDRKWHIYNKLKKLNEKHGFSFFYSAPYYNINQNDFDEVKAKSMNEKIALLYINGTISNATASKTINSIKKIKKDKKNVKAIIVRVDSPGGSGIASESILQHLKDCDIPVICSMGNYAASGGYFVAMNSQRIFAQPTTITGSIGVFGLKVDMSGLARQYGVNIEHLKTGPHSSSYNLFYPMTKPISDNFNRNVDRFYEYFKNVVSIGRDMSMDKVQSVAEGRVYTGEQAKDVGLVDELGGLSRVLAYVKRNYTSGDADVVTYPKPVTLKSKLKKVLNESDDDDFDNDSGYDENTTSLLSLEMICNFFPSSMMLCHQLLQYFSSSDLSVGKESTTKETSNFKYAIPTEIPPSISGIMLTSDEQDALRCLFQEHQSRTLTNEERHLVIFPDEFWV